MADDDRPPSPGVPPELTARALAAGLAVGAVLALGNAYMGLKTGFWDTGTLTATVLGFGLLSVGARAGGRGRPPSPLETNVAQTAAAAAGAAPAALGLLGAVPALALLGAPAPPPALLAGFGVAAGALGVLLALGLRRRLLVEEDLPFPSGVATAELVRAVHGRGRSGGGLVLGTGAAAAAFTALRDVAGALPASLALPFAVGGVPAASLGLGVAASPLLAGIGLVAGPRVALGLLAAAALAWAGLAPALLRAGWVAEASYAALAGWLAWPGVGLMLGAAAPSLAGFARGLGRALSDLRAPGAASRPAAAAALLAGVAAAGLAAAAFGMSPWHAALALALAPLLATACGRAAGQTDIAPLGEVGQLTLAGTALAARAAAPAAIGAGALVSGAAAQTGVGLWTLRAGRALGASPRAQGIALLAGAAAGVAVAIPAYALLAAAHGIGTAALPAPAAVPWRAIALATSEGLAGLPPSALPAAATGFAAGLALELLSRTRLGRFLPAAGALGIGFVAPASYSAAIALGGLAAGAWALAARRRAGGDAGNLQHLAAGAIAGEALAGVVIAAIAAAR
jgi:uncharacterized oligopeptide transporter (OPT) family protein